MVGSKIQTGADRLSLAYQGVCHASFFSPDPVHFPYRTILASFPAYAQ